MPDQKPRILIVEDEAIVADDLRDKLQPEYFVVGVAATGQEAIDLAQTNRPDVILMDVRLKGDLNGVQSAILIQSDSRRRIPVVFLSALSPDELTMLRAVEHYTYIRKPVSEENLLRSIQEMLRRTWYTIEEPA